MSSSLSLVGVFSLVSLSQSLSSALLSSKGVDIDTNTVYTGIFDANNILIHVSQNLFNFLTSTVAWLIVMPLLAPTTSSGRRFGGLFQQEDHLRDSYQQQQQQQQYWAQGRSRESAFAPSSLSSFLGGGKTIANILRIVADTAEGMDRY